jgi:hypothetical protein
MRSVALLLLPLLTVLGGCRTASPRETAIEYRPATQPTTRQAPYEATYTLHTVDTEGRTSAAIDRATVDRDNHVGFVRQLDGTIAAYAGGRKIPLPEGRYVWEMTPECQRKTRCPVGENTVGAVVTVATAIPEGLANLAGYVGRAITSSPTRKSP